MIERIKELVKLLNESSYAYYTEDREIMSNYEYDKLYDELVELERETGVVLSNSVTQKVGSDVASSLPKERHEEPMLSLDKTKSREDLKSFIGNREGFLSWKLDGLTVVLTYMDGKLAKAVTRGNGEIGEVITNNAKVFDNVPLSIPFKGKLVLRGEAIITYSMFDIINESLPADKEKFMNPRNLCSGSVRQLNSMVTKLRKVRFIAFNVVSAQGVELHTKKYEMEYLDSLGFETVDYVVFDNSSDIDEAVDYFAEEIHEYDYPSDGLVLTYNDIEYGLSLGSTNKFPRHSIAFKWQDEVKETTLIDVEWQVGRTGVITPVAIFEDVDLEGSTVSRASVHNITIMENLELGYGDTITVYKANMIIPQIADNLSRTCTVEPPEYCPVCGSLTHIHMENESEVLHCTNLQCEKQVLRRLSHFVSRDAMNIMNLSESTIEKLVNIGVVKNYHDIFRIEEYSDEILSTEGFAYKGYTRLLESIEEAKVVELPNFIYALGIPNVGLGNAKTLSKAFSYDLEALVGASYYELVSIEGIGDTIANSFIEYFSDVDRYNEVVDLLDYVELVDDYVEFEQKMEGLVFVCTGSLYKFSNRNALKDLIENMGGKLTGGVTSNTDYLITNDTTSGTSKNKKARELGVEIIDEDTLISMFDLHDYL